MTMISGIASAMSGRLSSAAATLVSGPIAMMVIWPGDAEMRSRKNSTAFTPWGFSFETGREIPSPSEP